VDSFGCIFSVFVGISSRTCIKCQIPWTLVLSNINGNAVGTTRDCSRPNVALNSESRFRVTSFIGLPITDYLGQSSTALISIIFVAVWKGFAFWMLIILAALQGVPKDQIEAAEVDGAGPIRTFFNIYVPNMISVLRIGFILTAIWTFNYFELVFVMTAGGPAGASHTFPTIIYEQAFRRLDFGLASRFAFISILIMLVLSIFLIREVRRANKHG
jgi:multiple sugar transport system permease protein